MQYIKRVLKSGVEGGFGYTLWDVKGFLHAFSIHGNHDTGYVLEMQDAAGDWSVTLVDDSFTGPDEVNYRFGDRGANDESGNGSVSGLFVRRPVRLVGATVSEGQYVYIEFLIEE